MVKELSRNITDFLNIEYLNYAMSVLEERAIPSVIDGFKPGARKIMHGALTGALKDGKTYKLLALSGDTMKLSLYAHGDASLNATITGLAANFRDNLNPIEIEGQGGSLRDDSAGSPRYLYIRHSKYMDKIYKTDYELLDFVFDEGQWVEPMNYLPIIPTILTKNNIGVAVGYSMHNQSYDPIDVIDACLDVLNSKHNTDKKIKTIVHPYVNGIKKSNWKLEDGRWFNYGEWKYNKSKDVMQITDLPADVLYEDFEKLLNKLVDKCYIKDWKNHCQDGKVDYDVIFPKKRLEAELKKDKSGLSIANKFKLVKQLPDDLLWLLDENHKLKFFQDKYEVIEYFTNYRLTIYTERKKRLVKILEDRYNKNSQLVKFIELVCKGKLKIRNRSKLDIKIDMDSYKLPIELISTPMSKVTIEERDELLKLNEEIKNELEYIKKTSEKQMYINDLNSLRKDLEKDFK